MGDGLIEIGYVPTVEMAADILTKHLSKRPSCSHEVRRSISKGRIRGSILGYITALLLIYLAIQSLQYIAQHIANIKAFRAFFRPEIRSPRSTACQHLVRFIHGSIRPNFPRISAACLVDFQHPLLGYNTAGISRTFRGSQVSAF